VVMVCVCMYYMCAEMLRFLKDAALTRDFFSKITPGPVLSRRAPRSTTDYAMDIDDGSCSRDMVAGADRRTGCRKASQKVTSAVI
jgi:hypothetical protein